MSNARSVLLGVGVGLLVIALLIGIPIAISRSNQLAACERGNILRRETNQRVDDVSILTQTVADFLASSERFRSAQGQGKLAAESRRARRRLEERVHFKRVPVSRCSEAVPLIP